MGIKESKTSTMVQIVFQKPSLRRFLKVLIIQLEELTPEFLFLIIQFLKAQKLVQEISKPTTQNSHQIKL